MNDRTNTIFGWVLASLIVALGGSIVAGKYFHANDPSLPEDVQPGYVIEAAEEGGAADDGPPLALLLAEGSAEDGAGVFARCQSCHNVAPGGANGIGPALNGVVGSTIGAHSPSFAYSSALKDVGGTWTYEALDGWLANPKAFAAGNKMAFPGLSNAQDRANVILYLRENGGGPPLPEVPAAVEGDGAADGEADAATVDQGEADVPGDQVLPAAEEIGDDDNT